MRTHGSTKAVVFGLVVLCAALQASRADAEPIPVSGFLSGDLRGALLQQQLDLTFPDFSISIVVEPQLKPGFCTDGCGDGTAVSFTQTTGVFSGHSTGYPSTGTVDADVTGVVSFFGPTEFISIAPELGGDVLRSAVRVSGFLRVTQPTRVLFDGMLAGSGFATVVYENRFGQFDTRLGGYDLSIDAAASTPEPSSLILVSSGVVWLIGRKRKVNSIVRLRTLPASRRTALPLS